MGDADKLPGRRSVLRGMGDADKLPGRRSFLRGVAGGVAGGVVAGGAAGYAVRASQPGPTMAADTASLDGRLPVVPFHGRYQAGIVPPSVEVINMPHQPEGLGPTL